MASDDERWTGANDVDRALELADDALRDKYGPDQASRIIDRLRGGEVEREARCDCGEGECCNICLTPPWKDRRPAPDRERTGGERWEALSEAAHRAFLLLDDYFCYGEFGASDEYVHEVYRSLGEAVREEHLIQPLDPAPSSREPEHEG